MEKLKSLKEFLQENPQGENLNLNTIHGGITKDTNDIVFTEKDTVDGWNCDDCCSYAVVDGMYGTNCP